jgi:hypothetical protein
MRENCLDQLRTLLGKRYVFLTKRGNASARIAVRLAKSIHKKKIILPDMGGWMTYPKIVTEEKLEPVMLKTDYGLLDTLELSKLSSSAILANSMPAYAYMDNILEIAEICKKNSILLVNDATGSIGYEEASIGDVILGSFKSEKPVDLGTGGFIATSNPDYASFIKKSVEEPEGLDLALLYEKLCAVKARQAFFRKVNQKIKADLSGFPIIHEENRKGINVIVRLTDPVAKDAIVTYCDSNGFEYTECPRYIRVTDPAISIEVKRLSEKR